jgi:hypothetical protein
MKRSSIFIALPAIIIAVVVLSLGWYVEFGTKDTVFYRFTSRFWNLPEGLGGLLGAVSGLLAIVMGALHNARLNRERDDRIEAAERRALAASIRGELRAIYGSYNIRRGYFQQFGQEEGHPKSMFILPDFIIYLNNATRLGLLGSRLTEDLAVLYNRIQDDRLVLRDQMEDGVLLDGLPELLEGTMVQIEYTADALKPLLVHNLAKNIESAPVRAGRD